MPTHDGAWLDGTPCWADCQVDDIAAAREFYTELFGWEINDGPEEAGGYLMALKDGRPAAGLGEKPAGAEGMPSVWTTYFATSDVDKTATAVTEAGGSVFMEAFDVMDAGRMTVAADPAGAALGLWQAAAHFGAGIVNEPGAMCWNELHTREYDVARTFYSTIFGYTYRELTGDFTYTTMLMPGDDQGVAGLMQDTMMPDGMPNYWLTWFAVVDADATTERALSLGATQLMPASDSPFGRMTVIAAPQGEVLGLIDLTVTG
jgi:predicted enzyme related to lactoylglutathione lyase